MALTRKFLKAMGVEDEKIDQILEAHTETVDGLKANLGQAQAEAGKLPDLQKQLETAQAELEDSKKNSYKAKYEALKEDFETFKNEQAKKDARAAKETAYRALLREAGVSEKRIDRVISYSDAEIDALTFDENGKVQDAAKLKSAIKAEWDDFIVTTEVRGAPTPNPPANNGGGMLTKADIFKTDDKGRFVMDTEARQKAIAENIELFRKE